MVIKKKWRKCMGIEPTDRKLYLRPNGFEDRGGHQPAKHFRTFASLVSGRRVPAGIVFQSI